MLETAEHQGPTEDQIDKLSQGTDKSFNTKAIAGINDLSDEVRAKINEAQGILGPAISKQLHEKIDSSSTSKKQALEAKREIEATIDFIRALKDDPNIDKKMVVNNEITRFLTKSAGEKEKYAREIQRDLAVLNELYAKVMQLAPDKVEEFRKLEFGKKGFVGKLERLKTYESMIDTEGELFTAASKKEYLRLFWNLPESEQKNWLDKGNFAREIQRKKQLTIQFEAFPKEIQDKFRAKFYGEKARKADRTIALQEMESEWKEQYVKAMDSDPNAKEFSVEDKKEAIEVHWNGMAKQWEGAARFGNKGELTKIAETRMAMIKGLKGQLNNLKEKMSKPYFDLPATVKLEIQATIGFTDYYQLPFAKKAAVKALREKLMEERKQNKIKYTSGLQTLVAQKYLATKSLNEFMDEFEEIDTGEQREWLLTLTNKDPESEIGKRIHVTKMYQEAVALKFPENKGKQQELLAKFYLMGFTERMQEYIQLMGGEEAISKVNPELSKDSRLNEMTNKARQIERLGNMSEKKETKQERWTEALEIYQELLREHPNDEIIRADILRLTRKLGITTEGAKKAASEKESLDTDEKTLSNALENAKHGEIMKRDILDMATNEMLIELVKTNEMRNNNATQFESRNKNLESGEREIEEELLEASGGKQVIGEDGTAVDVLEIDVTKSNVLEEGEREKLRKTAVTYGMDDQRKQKGLRQAKFKSKETGQDLNADMARQKLDANKQKMRQRLVNRAAIALLSQGYTVTREVMQSLMQMVEQDELKVSARDLSEKNVNRTSSEKPRLKKSA